MDFEYIRNTLLVFLGTFFFIHVFVRRLNLDHEINLSMLAMGLYIIFHVVKSLSGVKK